MYSLQARHGDVNPATTVVFDFLAASWGAQLTRARAFLDRFRHLTGVPGVLNTSFNVKDEPIVCSPRDALRCFYGSGMDALVIGDFVLEKQKGFNT